MTTPPAPGTIAAIMVSARHRPVRTLVMLHGIYGKGRNWQRVARAVTDARPEYGCWLVDLPHHGDSGPARHEDTVRGLAADLDDWFAASAIAPDVVLGHSFGAKVALACADRRREHALQTWVIDASPEARQPEGSAWRLLQVVRGLPDRFASRDEAVAAIVDAGYQPGVAQWMVTNLAREGESFRWQLDFDAMERLLRDFFTTDLWTVLESPAPRHDIHVLRATASNALGPEAAERIASAAPGRVHLHERDGGHWIHAESPEVVTALLLEHLP